MRFIFFLRKSTRVVDTSLYLLIKFTKFGGNNFWKNTYAQTVLDKFSEFLRNQSDIIIYQKVMIEENL